MIDNVIPIPIKVQYDDASKAFIKWVESAKRGDTYLYYSGPHVGGVQVARLAMKAYERGTITLYQSRNEKNFDYWAKKLR